MATLSIRKLNDRLYERIGQNAKRNNRSIEAEVREILANALPEHDHLLAELRGFHARMRNQHGTLADSAPLIRAMRDSE